MESGSAEGHSPYPSRLHISSERSRDKWVGEKGMGGIPYHWEEILIFLT